MAAPTLVERWTSLAAAAGVAKAAAGRWSGLGRELQERYAEPHRSYHTTRHLEQLLAAVDELATGAEDLVAVQLAGWFHDAVYAVPGAGAAADDAVVTNEEASARLATARLAGLVGREMITEVARLVRLTATHRPGPDDPSGCLLSDADMAILAAEPTEYRRYADAVRREYRQVSDADFARGRSAFLRSLDGVPIFAGPGRRLEARARANIADELARLAGGAPDHRHSMTPPRSAS